MNGHNIGLGGKKMNTKNKGENRNGTTSNKSGNSTSGPLSVTVALQLGTWVTESLIQNRSTTMVWQKKKTSTQIK